MYVFTGSYILEHARLNDHNKIAEWGNTVNPLLTICKRPKVERIKEEKL